MDGLFKIYNGTILYSLYFFKQIITGVAVLIALFFGYKGFKLIRTEKSPKQEFIKMIPTILIWLCSILFVMNYIASFDGGIDCERFNYNEKLNGGTKQFNGKKYIINICGSGVNDSHFFGDSMDKVQLTIINDQGELLAKRHYKVLWDGQPGHEPLAFGKNSVTYQDDEKQRDHTIAIPPTFIDWIRARIPLFN